MSKFHEMSCTCHWPLLGRVLRTAKNIAYFRFSGIPTDLPPLVVVNALVRRGHCVGINLSSSRPRWTGALAAARGDVQVGR